MLQRVPCHLVIQGFQAYQDVQHFLYLLCRLEVLQVQRDLVNQVHQLVQVILLIQEDHHIHLDQVDLEVLESLWDQQNLGVQVCLVHPENSIKYRLENNYIKPKIYPR